MQVIALYCCPKYLFWYWCVYILRVQPNCQDVNGETPLHLAALNGHRYVSFPVHYTVGCAYRVMEALTMHNSWSVIRTDICLLSHNTVYAHAILIPLVHLFDHVSCLCLILSDIVSGLWSISQTVQHMSSTNMRMLATLVLTVGTVVHSLTCDAVMFVDCFEFQVYPCDAS